MTPEQWKQIQNDVTHAMCDHTLPFVTPLGLEGKLKAFLEGTGSYVSCENRILLTCEHVARKQPMNFRFRGCEDVFEHPGPWTMERHPVDAAFAVINDAGWRARPHQSQAVPYSRFASRHAPSQQAEILFFRGFAGENANYGFGLHQTDGTGYGTQEKEGTGDAQIFELFWEPENIELTSQTSPEAAAEMKFENAKGFSGSLVWNTRFLEVTQQGRQWTPEDAVVTGMLRRWDKKKRTLMAWRVEHLRAWLDAKGA